MAGGDGTIVTKRLSGVNREYIRDVHKQVNNYHFSMVNSGVGEFSLVNRFMDNHSLKRVITPKADKTRV